MKLIDLKCPRCGATLKNVRDRNNIVCQYCGNSFVLDDETKVVRYDSESAEEAGYQFEKGRLRAQNESNSATTINGYVKQQKRKKEYMVVGIRVDMYFPCSVNCNFGEK